MHDITGMLWFDVGIKRYTTERQRSLNEKQLWFDVGIKRYTTLVRKLKYSSMLWFDVGIKRYTTNFLMILFAQGCGLM